jgi:hypothetical protein
MIICCNTKILKMNMKAKKTKPSWSNIKSKLSHFDRAGLLGIVHDLYTASKDNRNASRLSSGLSKYVQRAGMSAGVWAMI